MYYHKIHYFIKQVNTFLKYRGINTALKLSISTHLKHRRVIHEFYNHEFALKI